MFDLNSHPDLLSFFSCDQKLDAFCIVEQSLNQPLLFKGRLISKRMLASSNFLKNKPFIVRISALASKRDQINKIETLYYIA